MTVLILGGTGEARRLAALVAEERIDAVLSLAGATRNPLAMDLPTRIGGFGGEDGFRSFLQNEGITAVLDATHPFAARITDRTARICADIGMPYAQLLRPQWVPVAGDDWTFIDREVDAAKYVEPGSTVFLGTGRQTLSQFKNLEGCRVICRQIDPPTAPFPFPGGEYLIGRPPFSVDQEVELFTQLNIDWLIVKNAGGDASYTKLEAARVLGIKVIMRNRPDMPDAKKVETAQEALGWIKAQ